MCITTYVIILVEWRKMMNVLIINDYFENYSIITHTHFNYLGFFHHLNHHTEKNEGDEKLFRLDILRIAKEIASQKIDKEMIEKSKKNYSV